MHDVIAIVVAGSTEERLKTLLRKIVSEEGYNTSGVADGNVFRLVRRKEAADLSLFKEKVVHLDESFYTEKKGLIYKSVLSEIEKPLIENILRRTDGNQQKAAKILGINRNTMRTKIKKLGINPSQWKVT